MLDLETKIFLQPKIPSYIDLATVNYKWKYHIERLIRQLNLYSITYKWEYDIIKIFEQASMSITGIIYEDINDFINYNGNNYCLTKQDRYTEIRFKHDTFEKGIIVNELIEFIITNQSINKLYDKLHG